ncbi:MAG: hypothetical protein WDN25_13850 [Acetobacteraceae bacterium]
MAPWFGWPDDEELERLRTAWFDAPDLPAQKAIAAQVQARAGDHAVHSAGATVPVGHQGHREGGVPAVLGVRRG